MSTEFTQEITLPSKGTFNPEIPDGVLVQRCMMVKDQKYLSGSNRSASSAIHQLLQHTTVSPEDFDVMKLTLPDTLYMLFKLRVLSYGNEYRFRTRCPECGKKIEVKVDLSEVPVEILDDDYEDKLLVELPHNKDKVYTKVLTNQDIEEVNREVKRRKKRNSEDESEYILRIVHSIDKIVLATPNKDGKKELKNLLEIERYISALTDLDAATIIDSRDSVIYGIDPTVEYVCPECGEDIDISIQFSAEFFRPCISR